MAFDIEIREWYSCKYFLDPYSFYLWNKTGNKTDIIMDDFENPVDPIVEAAKDAISEIKQAAIELKEISDASLVLVTEESIKIIEKDWKKAFVVVGLGMVTMGVFIWAGFTMCKGYRKKGKEDGEK